ncbi:MAG: symporter small accessory protein [Mobilitalea sp.]
MLGLQDLNIFIVFSLCILCSIFCVVYGCLNWNKGQEKESDEMIAELTWEEKEDKINELL